jgi:Protein of unknown function (DUF1232)
MSEIPRFIRKNGQNMPESSQNRNAMFLRARSLKSQPLRTLLRHIPGSAARDPKGAPGAIFSVMIAERHNAQAWVTLLWFIALGYMISPVDVVPDVIPIVGWMDDLLLLVAAAYLQSRVWLGLSVGIDQFAGVLLCCGAAGFIAILLAIVALLKYILVG